MNQKTVFDCLTFADMFPHFINTKPSPPHVPIPKSDYKCYFYKCKYGNSGCVSINEEEYNSINADKRIFGVHDDNVDKTYKLCHPFNSYMNPVFSLFKNKEQNK